jgi:hypothetical protein
MPHRPHDPDPHKSYDPTQGSDAQQARKPQTQRKHPDEYTRDLEPDHMAGQHYGQASGAREQGLRTAHDLKGLHRGRLRDWGDDDLKQLPVLPPGARLQQGATYVDLNESRPREFTATGDMTAGPEHCYVPKNQTPYPLWNRLIGAEHPPLQNG